MPSDLSTWLTETDAAKRIGVSVRTIRRMASKGEVERRSRPISGRRPEAVYSPEDVDRLTAEKPFLLPPGNELPAVQAPLHPSLVQTLMFLREVQAPMYTHIEEAMATIRKSLDAGPSARPERARPWMTIREASAYTGLTRGFLRRQVAAGELVMIRDREGVKVRKADLDRQAGIEQSHSAGA
jgi:excisionase family DNA binding protein